ncbi:MAG: hypothetical protein HZB51_23920 [Chloroflexi bacterium]|nr:hypothetical protein [Chloroflexota bacterium]
MSEQKTQKHFSPRTTNILLGASVVILVATLLVRFLAPATWDTQLVAMGLGLQQVVLVTMGIGVFLFLLVAFDQPE